MIRSFKNVFAKWRQPLPSIALKSQIDLMWSVNGVSVSSYKSTPKWRKRMNSLYIHIFHQLNVETEEEKKTSIDNHKPIQSYIGPITMQQGNVFKKKCVQILLCNGAHTKEYDNASTYELLCSQSERKKATNYSQLIQDSRK